MQVSLRNRARKTALWGGTLILAAIYSGSAIREYLADHYSQKSDLASLQRAVRLQPANAKYRDRFGRYLSMVQESPEAATESYKAAVELNPYVAAYWLDLAAGYELLGNSGGQKAALEHAINADPRRPEVAWEAANFYIIHGETQRALRELRTAIQGGPALRAASLQLCWRVEPDVDIILGDAIPPVPDVYLFFLQLLISKKETAGAAKVWQELARLGRPIERASVFNYISYLISQQEIVQARLVWQQATGLWGMPAYQPSPANLVVNGDFSLDVLNGGFDWLYQRSTSIALALDPTQAHTGQRSLSIIFDGPGIKDAGIRQFIAVEPNTTYQFSANFRAEDMEGAGGPQFAIRDAFGSRTYFSSEELKGADFWKPVRGAFTTGTDTKLVVLEVDRVPAWSPIRGKLWIDGVRLAKANS